MSGFPFEALGLANKYDTELLAISRLGFGYDRAYLARAGGGKWPGLERAESALKDAAKKDGASVEEERRELYKGFQRAYQRQRAIE